MTREELAEIKARAEAATPGPWEYIASEAGRDDADVEGPFIVSDELVPEWCLIDIGFLNDANADFIAHARTDVPALVAEVERLTAELGGKP